MKETLVVIHGKQVNHLWIALKIYTGGEQSFEKMISFTIGTI